MTVTPLLCWPNSPDNEPSLLQDGEVNGDIDSEEDEEEDEEEEDDGQCSRVPFCHSVNEDNF